MPKSANEQNKATGEDNSAVSQEENQDGVMLEEMSPNSTTTTTQNSRRRKFILIGIAAFVILAGILAAVLLLVVFKPKRPIGYEAYTEDLLSALRGDRSYLGGQSDDTPQAKALKWIKSDTGSKVDVTPAEVMVERYTMAVFYYATDGPNWDEQAGFLTQPSICEWWNTKDEYLLCFGGSDLVTDLNFFNNSLGGTLPTEIGLLKRLFWFHLPANNIGGQIPSEIGEMTALTSLVLASNKLTGSLPTTIGSLTQIRTFEMENNDIGGSIPTTIGMLTNMETLYLGNNKVSGPIPSEIGRLVNASDLFLQSNDLSGTIPDTFGALSNLQFVYLQNNPRLAGSLEPLCEIAGFRNQIFRFESDCLDDLVTCSCCERC